MSLIVSNFVGVVLDSRKEESALKQKLAVASRFVDKHHLPPEWLFSIHQVIKLTGKSERLADVQFKEQIVPMLPEDWRDIVYGYVVSNFYPNRIKLIKSAGS